MRARIQKANVVMFPKYERDIGSVILYDDNDNPIFVAANSVAGTYEFSYIGMSDFAKIFENITGKKLEHAKVVEIDGKDVKV